MIFTKVRCMNKTREGIIMLVSMKHLAERLDCRLEEIVLRQEIDFYPCLKRKGVDYLYYQYLPEDWQIACCRPPESDLVEFTRRTNRERKEAAARLQVIDDWHDFLLSRQALDSEKLWCDFCRLQSCSVGRGNKVPGWAAVRAWWRHYLNHGRLGLCLSEPGKKRIGVTSLTQEMRAMIIAVLYNPDPALRKPHLRPSDLRRLIVAKSNDEHVPSVSAIRRWLNKWKRDNKVLVSTLENPDAARSKYSIKVGSRSADIVRLNQLWELDGTKVNVLCADGKRYVISAVIDVYSRRVKAHVTLTSTAASLSMLIRECVLDWGCPEEVVYDNGSEYVSADTLRLWSDLGIKQYRALPFSPNTKPHIESFFFTLSLRAELWPGYIGRSVADRKAIESRLAFDRRIAGTTVIRTNWEYTDVQKQLDAWLQDEYHFEPHSALGCSPAEKAAQYVGEVRRVDPRALDILLQPVVGGTRVFNSGYVVIDKEHYIPDPPESAPALGSEVIPRRSVDYGIVYLYDLQMNYICAAVCKDRLGADRADVAKRIKSTTKAHLDKAMSDLKRETRKHVKTSIHEEISAAARRKRIAAEQERVAAKVVEHNFRQVDVEYNTPALAEANKIVASVRKKRPESVKEPLVDPRVSYSVPLPVGGNYEGLWQAWLELDALLKAGEQLCADALAFYSNFQNHRYFKVKQKSRAA